MQTPRMLSTVRKAAPALTDAGVGVGVAVLVLAASRPALDPVDQQPSSTRRRGGRTGRGCGRRPGAAPPLPDLGAGRAQRGRPGLVLRRLSRAADHAGPADRLLHPRGPAGVAVGAGGRGGHRAQRARRDPGGPRRCRDGRDRLASPYWMAATAGAPARRSATTGRCWRPPAPSSPGRPRPARSGRAGSRSRNGCASPASCTTSSATPWPPSACRPGLACTSCNNATRPGGRGAGHDQADLRRRPDRRQDHPRHPARRHRPRTSRGPHEAASTSSTALLDTAGRQGCSPSSPSTAAPGRCPQPSIWPPTGSSRRH